MKRKLIIISLLLIMGITFRFWVGVYTHDEFDESYFFIKHRPIWKWRFYSPIGMSDKTLDNLNDIDKKEQLLFNEFILKQEINE